MDQYVDMPNNPFACKPGELMWDKYPVLARRREFCKVPEGVKKFRLPDLNKLLKFVVIFIDPLSPLASEKDFEYRRKRAMEDLGYEEDDRFYKEIDEMTTLYRAMVFQYFKMVNDHNYEVWFTLKTNLHILADKLRSPLGVDDSNRRHLTKSMGDFRKEIIELEHMIFPDKYTTQIVAEQATQTSLSGFAEKYSLILDT